MEEFWIQLLLLLFQQTSSASDTTELIRAVGGSVTFHSPSTDTKPALWSFGNDPIVSIVLGHPSPPVFLKEKFKTRFTVSERGRALTISQLRMEDAGTYSVIVDGKKTSTFILHVYRDVTKPTVTCKVLDCSGSICLVSLRCSVPGAGFGNVSYTWRGWDQQWNEGSMVMAEVDTSSWNNLGPLTCTARNVISSRSVTVPEVLCLAENSTHPPSSGAFLSSGVRIVALAGIGAAVGISLVFLIFLCKSLDSSPASWG